jgi:hypothetical protein
VLIISDAFVLEHAVLLEYPLHLDGRVSIALYLAISILLLGGPPAAALAVIIEYSDLALHVVEAALEAELPRPILLPPLGEEVLRPEVKLLTAHPELATSDHEEAGRRLTLLQEVLTQTVTPNLQVIRQGQKEVHVDALEDLYLRKERNALREGVLQALINLLQGLLLVNLEDKGLLHGLTGVLLLIQLSHHVRCDLIRYLIDGRFTELFAVVKSTHDDRDVSVFLFN